MFATPKRGAKILVVDDEPTVRRFVVAALQSNGFTVLQASSGQEGLKYFAEHDDVDLILSDVLMPTMSGPEMVQRIMKSNNVKVIFMTGGDPDKKLMELSGKKYSLLHKPFTADTVLKSVQDCLVS